MIGVVIPCFNEAERLDLIEVSAAVESHPEWTLLFVDDGSTDTTGEVLEQIRRLHPSRVVVLSSALNRGKGEAVRLGMLEALDDGADIVAYLDADVSTPFEELERLICRLESQEEVNVVLGARVRILGADVRRNPLRHVVGRVYATLASLALGVPVYDTQCGAKAFRRTPRLVDALSYPFAERWAFDVELLSRLAGHSDDAAWARIVEEPLLIWHARSGSKLGPWDAVQASAALLRIGWRHRSPRRTQPRATEVV